MSKQPTSSSSAAVASGGVTRRIPSRGGSRITTIRTHDARFKLGPGEGTDSVHTDPVYSYGVALLETDSTHTGVGLAFTLGGGNRQLCDLIELLATPLIGRDIEEIMANFGHEFRRIADHPQYRWLGPHKGIVHLALAAITNACYDLWAKSRGVPLWRLLLDLTPAELVATLDLSYVDDIVDPVGARAILEAAAESRAERMSILDTGYQGYDTSIGWMAFPDDVLAGNVGQAVDEGFTAMKLKVGSADPQRDIRRAELVRSIAGPDVTIMLDANQAWSVPEAIKICRQFTDMDPFWVEEPTHPDDVLGHAEIAREIEPISVATGEHAPNRVIFKNLLQANATDFVQVDCVRVGGISEFLTVSLLAKHFDRPVVPHVGDMGQIHQHLVLFNHIALDHDAVFLEHIPHLRRHFTHPATVEGGRYSIPEEPGSSSDLKEIEGLGS